jgi:type II secretory pathway pseudopilin PulG
MEMLVVIAIIGILSSILLGAVMMARGRGGETKAKALIFEVEHAAKQYEIDTGDFPPGAGGTDSAESLYEHLTSTKWIGRREFGKDEVADTDGDGKPEIVDHWKQPLSYYHHRSYREPGPPREMSFRLISKGPDGKEGTADDITNY